MKRSPDIWTTLFLAAILITALSFILPKDTEKYLRDAFWTRKTFAPAKYDIVLMGDSRMYRGLSPEVMKKVLPGMKILNFGWSNGGLNPAMFKAAEEKLADNSRSKVIVLGIATNTITGFTQVNTQFNQERTRSREKIIERLYLNPILYWFSSTSPSALIKHFFEKKDSSFYRNTYYMDGYVKSVKFPVDTMEAIPSYTNDFTNFKVEDKYLDELFRQVKKWSGENIIVVGFRPPVAAPMRQLEDSLGLYNETKLKDGIEKNGGYWIDINPSNYKTYDGSHVNVESAKKLSEKVAKSIRELLDK